MKKIDVKDAKRCWFYVLLSGVEHKKIIFMTSSKETGVCLERKPIDITCISDLHGFFPQDLPGGDLLIVAGDLTRSDEPNQYLEFNEWLKKQEYKRKIVIGGNHDNCLQTGVSVFVNPFLSKSMIPVYGVDVTYLCDSGTEFVLEYPHLEPCLSEEDSKIYKRNVLKIWGSPWTLKFKGQNPKAMAFTCDTEEELADKWAMIPEDTDILITHSPMWGLNDTNIYGERCGSTSLLSRYVNHHLNKLKLFICGHIHEAYGKFDIRDIQTRLGDPIGTVHVNASHVNERYEPVNKPVRVIL